MRLNFLCHHHRRELMSNPEAARDLWLDGHRRLTSELPLPTPHLVNLAGSALEAAGIYLLARPACDAAALDRYVASALSLVDMLAQLQQTRLATVVVAGASAMVEQLARSGADHDAALHACRRLTLEGMQFLEPTATPAPPVPASETLRTATVTLH